MEVHFTPEQEAQLAEIATSAGTNSEHLVKDAALRLLTESLTSQNPSHPTSANPLPSWHLGAMGSLRRSEIYDDVR